MTRVAPIFLLIAVLPPLDARGEAFIEGRVGGAFTEDNDVEVSVPGASIDFSTEYDESITGGGRFGYWFESLPWLGLAVDVSYFAPDDDTANADYDVIPVSPLLMLRAPLATSEEFRNGRIQPFLGVGPGIFVSSADFSGAGDDDTTEVGADVHAGLNFQVTRMVSIFGEYRYTYVEPEFHVLGVDIEPELSTHHIALGMGFHF
jgi:opacity protein-like surface antigen